MYGTMYFTHVAIGISVFLYHNGAIPTVDIRILIIIYIWSVRLEGLNHNDFICNGIMNTLLPRGRSLFF